MAFQKLNRNNVTEVRKHSILSFDSVVDLVAWIKTNKETKPSETSYTSADEAEWRGGPEYKHSTPTQRKNTIKDMYRRVDAGWQYGVDLMRHVASDSGLDVFGNWSEASSVSWQDDEEGDEVDIDAFLNHDPEPYSEPVLSRGEERTLRVAVSVTSSCYITSDQKVAFGVGCLAAISELHTQGIRIGLDAYKAGRKRFEQKETSRMYAVRVTLKEIDSDLHLPSVAFALANPAFLRVLMFQVCDRLHDGPWYAQGYSHHQIIPNVYKPTDQVVFIAPNWKECQTATDHYKMISKTLSNKLKEQSRIVE
jgi:hypothetical protein